MRINNSCKLQHDPINDGYQESGLLFDGYTVTANMNSIPFYVGGSLGYTLVASCPSTGTPNGTIKLQGCIDHERIRDGHPDAALQNWFDLTLVDNTGASVTTATISGASTIVFIENSCFYRFIRAVVVNTSGSMNLTITCQFKGIL